MYVHTYIRCFTCTWKSDCLGCAVLLCLVFLFDLACFFLSSFSSLIKTCIYIYIYYITVFVDMREATILVITLISVEVMDTFMRMYMYCQTHRMPTIHVHVEAHQLIRLVVLVFALDSTHPLELSRYTQHVI